MKPRRLSRVMWSALCGGLLASCASSVQRAGVAEPSPDTAILVRAESAYQLGRQSHLAGQPEEAQRAYEAALTLVPEHAGARNGLAALHGERGELGEAIVMLTALAQTDPQPHVFINLGIAYRLRNDLVRARAAFEQALLLDPDHARARELLGQVLVAENPLHRLVEVGEVPPSPSPEGMTITRVANGSYVLHYDLNRLMPSSVPAALPVAAPVAETSSLPEVSSVPSPQDDRPPAVHVPVATISELPSDSSSDRRPQVALPIELLNGNGVNGFARRLRGELPPQQWRVVRTANHRHYRVKITRINYAEGFEAQARTLADTLGVEAQLVKMDGTRRASLRVVLGQDAQLASARARVQLSTARADLSGR